MIRLTEDEKRAVRLLRGHVDWSHIETLLAKNKVERSREAVYADSEIGIAQGRAREAEELYDLLINKKMGG